MYSMMLTLCVCHRHCFREIVNVSTIISQLSVDFVNEFLFIIIIGIYIKVEATLILLN